MEAKQTVRKKLKVPNSQIPQRLTDKGLLDEMGYNNLLYSQNKYNHKNKEM